MSKRPDPRKKPATTSASDRPKKSRPAATAAPMNKKAAARAAGDAARAAGFIDNFADKRPQTSKSTPSKPETSIPASSKPAGRATTPGKPAKKPGGRPGGKPGRKIPTIFEAEILRLDDDGVGCGRLERKELLIPGVYPGEKIAFTVEAEGPHRVFGRLRKIVTPHPDRIISPCRCSNNCQGCPLIALNYPAQLAVKQARVAADFARYRSLQGVAIAPVWGAEHPFSYRTNAKLIIAKHRGVVSIGLYRRGTHAVVDIGDCPLHHPLINRIVAVVKEEITRQDIHVYDPHKERGLLRYLAIKVSPSQNKAMVTFVTLERDYRQITHLGKWLEKKIPEVVSIQQNINSSSGNAIFGRETLRILGAPDLLDQIGDIRLRISPTSFFQVNNEQAGRIYQLVRQWTAVGPQETAVDLYCGIGGIALHLARSAGTVIGIELSEEAVRNARENARLNGVNNCRFNAGDAGELAEELADLIPVGAVVVVNPPRGGCDAKLLKAVATQRPRMLIYVSCNPESLARDLDLLHNEGYHADAVQPVDMFPQTGHIETVVRLLPAPPEARTGSDHRSSR